MVVSGISRVCGTTFDHIIGSGVHITIMGPMTYLVILVFHMLHHLEQKRLRCVNQSSLLLRYIDT